MEILKITKIIKTGSSLCIVIPKNILHALKWERGDQVVFGIHNGESVMVYKITEQDILKWKT